MCGKSAKRVENNRLSRFLVYLLFYLCFDLLLLSSQFSIYFYFHCSVEFRSISIK